MFERVSDEALGPLTDDAITGDHRLWQRRHGHRYSLDDVLVAYEGASARPDARRVLDLGSGIGSVALMLAWKLPEAQLTTIEAQAISLTLQERNLARNDLGSRVTPIFGDFRDPAVRDRAGLGCFDLVTGTPPYFPEGTATPPPDSQKAHARIELRGGVEAYLEAGQALLADDGVLVVCGDAKRPERVTETARRVGLTLLSSRTLMPRRGKPPLVSVWTLRRARSGDEAHVVHEHPPFFGREADGGRTEDAQRVRSFFGLVLDLEEQKSPPTRPRRSR